MFIYYLVSSHVWQALFEQNPLFRLVNYRPLLHIYTDLAVAMHVFIDAAMVKWYVGDWGINYNNKLEKNERPGKPGYWEKKKKKKINKK